MVILLGVAVTADTVLKSKASLLGRNRAVVDNSRGGLLEYRFYNDYNETVDEVIVELPALDRNVGLSEIHASGLLLCSFSTGQLPIIESPCNHGLVYSWLQLAMELLETAARYTDGVRTFTVQVRENEAVVCSFKRFNV